MKTKKMKTMFVVVFLILLALPQVSITGIDKSQSVMRQFSNTHPVVLQVIYTAQQENPEKIYIFVSDKSVSDEIINHPEMSFDMSLFTFTGWETKPKLNDIYAYMYEDEDKFVAFIGPQPSISPNVPAHELGHMFSSIFGHVSGKDEWMQICHNVWQEKSFHLYFVPSGHTEGCGFTAEEQAAEELFAECVAYLSEGKLAEFMGSYAGVAEEFITKLAESYIAEMQ